MIGVAPSDDQAGFASALLDPGRPAPAGLRAWNGSDPAARFAVYRNNVVVSLVAALAETFPVVRALVGKDFFDAMARVFVATQPPRSPVLAEYGADLPGFIAGFAPAASLPYLSDVARLEYARVRAFHAADAPTLDATQLAARLAQPERLPGARLSLHPAVQAIVSAHAVTSLWAAHQGLRDLADVDPAQPEAALVLREDDDAAVIPLPHAAAAFVLALQRGQTLAEAAGAACAPAADSHAFDLPAALALLIAHGALSSWHFPEDAP
jgi:hypothetical protein